MDVGIFERAVQDPCSEECDCEDEDPHEEEQEQEPKRCRCKPPMVGLQRAITTNSISVSPSATHTLTHSRTAPSPTLSRPPRSRASSTSLLRHMSSDAANRSRSCCGIPAHLYGLEKYVSSALDALSAGDYGFHSYGHADTAEAETALSSSSSSPSRGSVPLSELSQSSVSVSRTQFAKRGRKKSFIEISLSKSFSP